MKSFRTELENPIVERDIIDLEKKIYQFETGIIDDDSFRSLRLARGVYGQRQKGVQMVRIKVPLGIIAPNQLRNIARVSDEYSDGLMHITTRQDIQIHHVSLDDTPNLWADLEKDQITLREACGNTVRNITASPFAGVDPNEPFDITPYGWTLFTFFLRNPVGAEMGRKFKIALSATENDLARTYMHDLGLIPLIKENFKGFKVLLGGGLGGQPALAEVIRDFLPVEDLIPYSEAIVRVFDQYGERNKRHKARLKFLVKDLGLTDVIEKIETEFQRSLFYDYPVTNSPLYVNTPLKLVDDLVAKAGFQNWSKTNVRPQKDEAYVSVTVKIRNGNITTDQARGFASLIEQFSPEEGRLTIEQNIVIRSVKKEALIAFYNALFDLGFADFGAGRITDITACPGTKTCNLGITASYDVAAVLEDVLLNEYQQVILEKNLQIKISGCMNACGQHTVSDIGFHGSTIRTEDGMVPALQVLLGGVIKGGGAAQFGDKIIKIPTKRVRDVIRFILDDYEKHASNKESFNSYYNRNGKMYFYTLLKPLASVVLIKDDEFLDWGASEKYQKEIGVGECAGVKIDLVKTLLYEAYSKIEEAEYFIENKLIHDAVYSAYSSIVQTAKAFLVRKNEMVNSKAQIVKAFEVYYPLVKSKFLAESFSELVDGVQFDHNDVLAAKLQVELAERFHLLIDQLQNEK